MSYNADFCESMGCKNKLGNRRCDDDCNYNVCNFDGGDCDECADGCPYSWVGDDQCDQKCMVEECNFDAPWDFVRDGSPKSPKTPSRYPVIGRNNRASDCPIGCATGPSETWNGLGQFEDCTNTPHKGYCTLLCPEENRVSVGYYQDDNSNGRARCYDGKWEGVGTSGLTWRFPYCQSQCTHENPLCATERIARSPGRFHHTFNMLENGRCDPQCAACEESCGGGGGGPGWHVYGIMDCHHQMKWVHFIVKFGNDYFMYRLSPGKFTLAKHRSLASELGPRDGPSDSQGRVFVLTEHAAWVKEFVAEYARWGNYGMSAGTHRNEAFYVDVDVVPAANSGDDDLYKFAAGIGGTAEDIPSDMWRRSGGPSTQPYDAATYLDRNNKLEQIDASRQLFAIYQYDLGSGAAGKAVADDLLNREAGAGQAKCKYTDLERALLVTQRECPAINDDNEWSWQQENGDVTYFRFSTRSLSYDQAHAEAANMGGRLVSFNGPNADDKMQFIKDNVLQGQNARMEFWAGTIRKGPGSAEWVNVDDSEEERSRSDRQLTADSTAWRWWKTNEPNNAGDLGERFLLVNYHFRAYPWRMDFHGEWNDIRSRNRYRYALIESHQPLPQGGCLSPYNGDRARHDRICNWRSHPTQCSYKQCLFANTPGGDSAFPSVTVEESPKIHRTLLPEGTRCEHKNKRIIGDHCDAEGECVGDLPSWACRAFGDPHFTKFTEYGDDWPRPIYHTMWAPDDRFYAPQPDTLDGELLFSETTEYKLYLRFFRLTNTYASGNKYARVFFPATAEHGPLNLVVDKDTYGWDLYDASGPGPQGDMINAFGQYLRVPFQDPYFGARLIGQSTQAYSEFSLENYGLGADASVNFRGFPRPVDLFSDRPTTVREAFIIIELSASVRILISRWNVHKEWVLNVNLYTDAKAGPIDPENPGPADSVSTGGYCRMESPPTADMCALLEGRTPEAYMIKMATINYAEECCEGLSPHAKEACESDFCILYNPDQPNAFSTACRKDDYDDPCEPCVGDNCDDDKPECKPGLPTSDCDDDKYTECGVGNAEPATCDCNDADPLINPGMPEICGDGKDNNCDGNVDDFDGRYPGMQVPCDYLPVAQCMDTITIPFEPTTPQPVPCVDDGSYDEEGGLAYTYAVFHECKDCTAETADVEEDGTFYKLASTWTKAGDPLALKWEELTKTLVRLTVTDNVGQTDSCDTVIEVSHEANPTEVVAGPAAVKFFGEGMEVSGWAVRDADLPRPGRTMPITIEIVYHDTPVVTGMASNGHAVQLYAPLVQLYMTKPDGSLVSQQIAQSTCAGGPCDTFAFTVTDPADATAAINSIHFTSMAIKTDYVLDFSVSVTAEDAGSTTPGDGPVSAAKPEHRFKPLCTQQFLTGCATPLAGVTEYPPYRVESDCGAGKCARGWVKSEEEETLGKCVPDCAVWGPELCAWTGTVPDYSSLICGIPASSVCLAVPPA